MNNIKFITEDPLIKEHFSPKPASECIPKWYQNLPIVNLKESEGKVNAKNCLPMSDMISAGYIIFNAYQIQLEEKFANFQNMLYMSTMKQPKHKDIQTFTHTQCPYTSTQKDVFKIKLDWKIVTPPGYSCLIQQPAYLPNTTYQLFPSVVDTDTFDDCISISGIVLGKGQQYINPGDPLLQIIPFKREEWKMTTDVSTINSKIPHFLFDGYKKLFHKIKKFV